MVSIVVFHILLLLLGLGIASRAIPTQLVSNMLGYLHKTIGITTPSAQQVRMVALIWNGCILLLLFIASVSNSG